MEQFISDFEALTGVALLITAIVNALKTFGVVKDGQSPTVVVGLNILGMILMLVMQVVRPGYDLAPANEVAGSLAQVLSILAGLAYQLLISHGSHLALKGTPLIGKSFSLERENDRLREEDFIDMAAGMGG